MRALSPALLWLLSCCAACEPLDVRLELNFPSSEALERGETVDLFAVPIHAREVDRCPALLAEALVATPDGAMTLAHGTPSCAWLDGLSMRVPSGALAYVVVVRDSKGKPALLGCSARASDTLNTVRVVLAPAPSLLIDIRAEIAQHTRPISENTPDQICAMRGSP